MIERYKTSFGLFVVKVIWNDVPEVADPEVSPSTPKKFAVIVPVPLMVAVVDAEPELANVIEPVLLDQEPKP